jgi:hypothetical protein
MASGRDIFVINKSHLAELKDGKLVKFDIEMPFRLIQLSSSMDYKIIAYCEVGDSYLIYELTERQFVLRHTFSKFIMGIPGYTFSLAGCQYVQNMLILKRRIDNINNFEVIDLDANSTILMCFGSCPFYCDGIISIPPVYVKHSSKYHNINLVDKSITHDCPYFMKEHKQLIEPYSSDELRFANGFTIINDTHLYHVVTGMLLCTGDISHSNIYFGNYFITESWMTIVEGAPVVEYTYSYGDKYVYIYVVKSGGYATKAAIK